MKRLIITLCAFVSCIASQLPAIPAQVIIIGHGEVNASGNLSQKGLERAGALAPYIGLTPSLTLFGTPVAIFAARPTPPLPPYGPKENNQRCIQTVGPTALYLRLPIHSGYAKLEETEIANFILNDSFYDGKNVLICWQQEAIQALATAFGVIAPPVFPVNVFNETWVITFSPTATLLPPTNQMLLFLD